jgi:deferrochelatase/peroxidase EfeB
MNRLKGFVAPTDEVHGFSYFDDRDLIGFVDGTENPVDQAAAVVPQSSVRGFGFCRWQLRHRAEVSA